MTEMMRFKDFVWSNNPAKVNISAGRNVKSIKIPQSTNIFQDMGREKCTIFGQGQFLGEAALSNFAKLSALLHEGEAGSLSVPGVGVFSAHFSKLSLLEQIGGEFVSYEFEFLGEEAGSMGSALPKEFYTVKEGETLWEVATSCSATVEALLGLNPYIKNPNELEAGQKVRVR